MNINYFEHENRIVEPLIRIIEEVLQTKDYFRLCLSGGTSTLKTLELLSNKRIPWEKIIIYQTDDRVVSIEHKDSNYYWLKKFLGNTKATIKPFFSDESLSNSLENYSSYLKEYSTPNSAYFDFLLLGFGSDGHVASLFPNSDDLECKDEVLFVKKKQNGYQRLSLSLSRIKNSKETFLISYGENKLNILKENIKANLPISLFVKNQTNVTWYHKR